MNKQSNWLLSYAFDVASQIGQDGIIEKLFSVIGTKNKYCVEFGAGDGKTLSNTWNLTENQEWHGLLIEGNEQRFGAISSHRSSGRTNNLNIFVSLTGPNSLDEILSRVGEHQPDFFSIDIDGNDWHVWNSMQRSRPRVILVEFNPTVPNDVFFVQDADFNISQGASLLAFIELGKQKGYSLACVDQWDAFFVQDDLFGMLGIADNSIDAMFDPIETKIFQCFDGTMYTSGNRVLLWSQTGFAEDQIQVLSRERRVYQDHQKVC